MLRLRKILLCDFFYYGLLLLAILYTITQLNRDPKSYYSEKTCEVIGIITSIQEKNGIIIYQIKAKETLLATSKELYSFQLGDTIHLKGSFEKPESTSDKDLWDYQKYLAHKKIYYIIRLESAYRIKKNKNIYYRIKQKLIYSLHKNPYLYTFLLGDKSLLKSNVKRSYQENGISHLFAISGMHISFLANNLEKILKKKMREETCYKFVSFFLLIYLFFVGFSPSIVRGVCFYIFFRANNIYYFYIKKENLFWFVLSISLFMNPFSIYDIGFQYSYFISYSLLRMSSFLNSSSTGNTLIKVSCLSFLVSIPITLKNYNQLNLLSIIYNLFYVPYVSNVVFPFSILTFLCYPLEPFYQMFTSFLESSSLFLENVSFGKIIWRQLPNIIYWIYFGILCFFLHYKKTWLLLLFFFLLFLHFLVPYFDSNTVIKMIDVGQGDSSLIQLDHKNIMIDTGGKGENGAIYFHILGPTLKHAGISKIHYLILTHGGMWLVSRIT